MDISTNYHSIVPDIGTGSTDVPTQPIPGGGEAGTSFKDTVKSLLGDVNDKVTQSDQLSRDLATGRTNDVSKVVTSVEEANLAMQFTLAIRNKLLDAYSEISRMQV
ncbi:MAG: flagellar hook-basal body complex protein FliE [Candidatus Baltobacteraceae bacterium]